MNKDICINKVMLLGKLSKPFQMKAYKDYTFYESEMELSFFDKKNHVKIVAYASKYNSDLIEKCMRLPVGIVFFLEGSISSKRSGKEGYTDSFYNTSISVKNIEVIPTGSKEDEFYEDDVPF